MYKTSDISAGESENSVKTAQDGALGVNTPIDTSLDTSTAPIFTIELDHEDFKRRNFILATKYDFKNNRLRQATNQVLKKSKDNLSIL